MIAKNAPPPGWEQDFRKIGDEFVPTVYMRRSAPVLATLGRAHEYYARESAPAVLAFAERVAAWLRSDASDVAYNRTALWGSSRTEWDADAIEEAARTGGPLPGESEGT